MTIQVVQFKTQVKRHEKHAKATLGLDAERHILACEDLQHAALHGDVSLCKHLFDTLGGAESAQRTATLKAWFVMMSGDQMTADKGEWKLKKGWTVDKFNLDKAENTPYWTLGGEKAPTAMSFEAFLKMLEGFPKRIDKAVSEDRFNGDPDAVKAIVAGVIDFTKERAKKLTKQQTGELSNQADAILAEDGPVPMQSVG